MNATKELTTDDLTEVFAVPGSDSIIDFVHPYTGRGAYSSETLEQVRLRYPGAQLFDFAEWQKDKAARQDAPVKWLPIRYERFLDALETLPPVAWHSAAGAEWFCIGEPFDHHAVSGQPRYTAFVRAGDSYYKSGRPVTIAEFPAARQTIHHFASAEVRS